MRKWAAVFLIALCTVTILPRSSLAVHTFRVDTGIVEEVKLAIQESKKYLERYVIHNLDDLEAIKDLKNIASDYDEILTLNDQLKDFLSNGGVFADASSVSEQMSPESLLNEITDAIEESEGIDSGKTSNGKLSGQSGKIIDIAQKEGYATALSTAVSRASEIANMRTQTLTGESSNQSGTKKLTDLVSILRSSDKKDNVLTADGTIYISDPKTGATVRRTPVKSSGVVRSYKIDIISGEQAQKEINAKGRLTESKGTVGTGTSDAVEYSVAKAVARSKLDAAFPAQNSSLIGTITSVAASGNNNRRAQMTVATAGADAVKSSMAGAGAEIQERYFNSDSPVGYEQVSEEAEKEIQAQSETLSAGTEDSAETYAARALGVIVRQQHAILSMTKLLAQQHMDIVELAGLTANVASMKSANKMSEGLVNRITAAQSMPPEYYLKRAEEEGAAVSRD